MISRMIAYATLVSFIATAALADDSHKLAGVKKTPDQLSKKISAALATAGHQVVGPDGPLCEVWLVKNLETDADFSPTLSVKYPFAQGQLIGALKVAESAEFTDFRGQEMAPGVYTLRYGRQPEDGNHIGTSQLADFLLALPAKVDQDPKTVADLDKMVRQSGEAVGSTHPAIFSLLPVEEPVKTAQLTHNEDHDFWILSVTADGQGKSKKVPLRMVAVGHSEE